MHRRNFIKSLSIGLTALAIAPTSLTTSTEDLIFNQHMDNIRGRMNPSSRPEFIILDDIELCGVKMKRISTPYGVMNLINHPLMKSHEFSLLS